jgi:hypothetical protein
VIVPETHDPASLKATGNAVTKSKTSAHVQSEAERDVNNPVITGFMRIV